MASDSGNAAGRRTRQLLVHTAERLFAERGFEEVSLREIAAAAGQRNPSAVAYHFGGKDDIIRAIYRYRFEANEERRTGLLAELEAAGRTGDLPELWRVMLLPFADHMCDPDSHYVGFTANLVRDRRRMAMVLELMGGASRRIIDLIIAQLGHLPDDRRWDRLVFCWYLLSQALADHEYARARSRANQPTELFLSELINVLTEMSLAPYPEARVSGWRGEEALAHR